jgi:hypothetical protein
MLCTGIGTLYSQTGVYVGQWSGGIQNGLGKSFFNNGNLYEGEYKDGFKHGKGTFTVQVCATLRLSCIKVKTSEFTTTTTAL